MSMKLKMKRVRVTMRVIYFNTRRNKGEFYSKRNLHTKKKIKIKIFDLHTQNIVYLLLINKLPTQNKC